MIPSSRFSSVLLVLFAAIFVTLALSAVEVKGQWGLIGTFDPARGSDLDRTAAIGAWTGKNQAVQLVFTTFDWQENNWLWNALVAIWNQGAVPIISWEPWFQQANGTPENIEVLIANGQYDTYISGWANSLKTFLAGPDGKMNTADDRRAYMRFAHEMNGNWYPWSARTGESSPNDYVRMWRKVQSIVTNAGCSRSQHVQWISSGICIDVGDFKIEQYYPGNDYVDWVGLGGMNWGTSESWAKWNMPVDLFAQMVPRVRALSGNTKPFGITEYCVVTNGGGIGGKNNWITTMFDFAKQNQIKMMSYFNMDKNEGDNGGLKDWAIFGGVNGDETYWQNGRSFKGYSAYRTAVGSNYWIAGNTNLAKRIDDKYFFGTGTCNTNNDCLSGYSCSGGNCVEGSSTNDQASSGGNSAPAPAISSSSAPSSKTKTVFSDSVAPPAYSWGSGGLSFKYNAGDSSAPEGKNSAQVTSTGWGGFGLFYDPNWQSFSGYSKIRFSMKSNNAVKLELQDSNGAKAPSYVPSTNGAWKIIEIPLSTFSNAGVNLGSINGAFVTTMEAAGQYSVDDIQFV